MPFKYSPFKVVTEEENGTPIGIEKQEYNRQILAQGVVGLACLDNRPVSRGERLDYEQFAPWGTMLSGVEVYEDGSMNIYVRNKLTNQQVGVILVRPLTKFDCCGKIIA